MKFIRLQIIFFLKIFVNFEIGICFAGELRKSVFPLMLYQTGPKFRDEITVGYGLLRSREFLMNDLYSFDISRKNALETYSLVNEVCHCFIS